MKPEAHPMLQEGRVPCPCCDDGVLEYEKRVRKETGRKLSMLELREHWRAHHPDVEDHWFFQTPIFLIDPRCDEIMMTGALRAFKAGQARTPAGPQDSDSKRTAERLGMICALGGALSFLQMNFPACDLEQLEPLRALWRAIRDLEKGITAPALRADKKNGQHTDPALAIDLKARCIVASDLLRRHISKSEADQLVLRRAQSGLASAGIKVPGRDPLESWRRSARRAKSQRKPTDKWTEPTLAWAIDSHHDSVRHFAAVGFSVVDLVDMLLKPAFHCC
jgi:hypothetical protein